MNTFVVDTHALVWYLGGSLTLGDQARDILDSAVNGENHIIIPAIVLAELVMLIEKGRIVLDISTLVTTLHALPSFEFKHLSSEVALSIHSLTSLSDIHDRLIVAEAIAGKATLITRDQAITASGLAPVVW